MPKNGLIVHSIVDKSMTVVHSLKDLTFLSNLLILKLGENEDNKRVHIEMNFVRILNLKPYWFTQIETIHKYSFSFMLTSNLIYQKNRLTTVSIQHKNCVYMNNLAAKNNISLQWTPCSRLKHWNCQGAEEVSNTANILKSLHQILQTS